MPRVSLYVKSVIVTLLIGAALIATMQSPQDLHCKKDVISFTYCWS